MKWYNILSAPFALLYGMVVLLRNGLYKAKILHATSVHVPTICVGNLSVGGTGKTPFVEYLLRALQNDYQVAVLSRGYRRSTSGFVLADDSSTARTIGDEPMQIHTKFPNIPVAVCADRVYGVRKLKSLYPHLQAVILDDAYQHRALKCGFYILLTAYDNLYINDHFLPLGSLRDARMESLRASAVVVTKCPDTMRPIDQRIVDNKLHLPAFQQLCFSHIVYPTLPKGQRVLLVTGIAHPEHLYQRVLKDNPHTLLLSYPDHHTFSNIEMDAMDKKAHSYDVVLTTEKDYARLRAMSLPDSLAAKLQVVPITIELYESDNLMRLIRQYINENLHTEHEHGLSTTA